MFTSLTQQRFIILQFHRSEAQLISLLWVPQGQNEDVSQPGLLPEGFGRQWSFRLLKEFSCMWLVIGLEVPISLLALSRSSSHPLDSVSIFRFMVPFIFKVSNMLYISPAFLFHGIPLTGSSWINFSAFKLLRD